MAPAEINSTLRRLLNRFHAGDLIKFFGVLLLVLPKNPVLALRIPRVPKIGEATAPCIISQNKSGVTLGSSTIFNF